MQDSNRDGFGYETYKTDGIKGGGKAVKVRYGQYVLHLGELRVSPAAGVNKQDCC